MNGRNTSCFTDRQKNDTGRQAAIAPQLAVWLEKYNRLMAIWLEKGTLETPARARDGLARLTRTLVTEVPALTYIEDSVVTGCGHPVPVRVYHPHPDQILPVLVYMHGGGHMAGSVAIFDPICRKMALATQHVVIAVEYRLAPEHPYPAGLQDCLAVLSGCSALLDRLGCPHRHRLALAGDSAGGAMAATLAHRQKSRDIQTISHLVLLYPSLDYTLSLPSVESLAKGYLLEKERIQWYLNHYFQNNEDRTAVSPLFMAVPRNFPPTLLISAEFCPLRDEAHQYGQHLKNHGVQVRHCHFDDMVHAFLNMEDLAPERCREVYRAMAEFLV